MADEGDLAQDYQTRLNREAIARVCDRQPGARTAARCEDCGETISPARRTAALGCTRCVACQQEYEEGKRAWERA